MRISHEKLIAQAEATGFRVDVLEKVAHLLELLNALSRHPFLKGKRIPLGPVTKADSHHAGAWQATEVSVIHAHELAAGKPAALMARRQSRDLLPDRGVIDSSLLTSDLILQQSINDQSLLRWKTVNVRKYKGL